MQDLVLDDSDPERHASSQRGPQAKNTQTKPLCYTKLPKGKSEAKSVSELKWTRPEFYYSVFPFLQVQMLLLVAMQLLLY